MRLEVGAAARSLGRIDHAALRRRRLRARRRAPPSRRPHTRPSSPVFSFKRSPMVGSVCGGRVVAWTGSAYSPARIARRGRIAARLIRRLHGVHRAELAVAEVVCGRDVAALRELRRSIERGGGSAGGGLQARQKVAGGVRLQDRDRWLRGRAIGIRILGRAGADQVLMVQERAAERPLKKVIRQHVLAGEREQARNRCSRNAPWSDRRHPTRRHSRRSCRRRSASGARRTGATGRASPPRW